jgi:hypothetical protein
MILGAIITSVHPHSKRRTHKTSQDCVPLVWGCPFSPAVVFPFITSQSVKEVKELMHPMQQTRLQNSVIMGAFRVVGREKKSQ